MMETKSNWNKCENFFPVLVMEKLLLLLNSSNKFMPFSSSAFFEVFLRVLLNHYISVKLLEIMKFKMEEESLLEWGTSPLHFL